MGVFLSKPGAAALALASVTVAHYAILRPLYNLFFHPLSRYPGPTLWAMYRIPLSISKAGGHMHTTLADMHNEYGEIVRIAPEELSFVQPEAWKEIMGHRKPRENGRDRVAFAHALDNIVGAHREQHGQFRRNLSHGFSARKMLEQEPLIQQYIDMLIQRIGDHAESDQADEPMDMCKWYNLTTFDLVGDLALGESFGSLKTGEMHPWVSLIFDSVRVATILNTVRMYIPSIETILAILAPSATTALQQHEEFGREKVRKRLAIQTERPDFIDTMTRTRGDADLKRGEEPPPPMTFEQIAGHASLLVLAGSETSATVLAFTTFLLCKHTDVLERVREEVDSKFKTDEEIDITACQDLKYLLAVIDESMRLYPAAPCLPPRVTPDGGAEVFGHWVPGDTRLGITQAVAFRYPGNFALPNDFHPERWIGNDARFADDKKEVFQPFSHGPRDCIAKNLAYAELRVILTRIVFNFDMKLDERSDTWADNQPTYMLWDKGPLWVHLQKRQHVAGR